MKFFSLLKLVDYTIATLMGIGTLFLVSIVVGSGWNILFSMLVGMLLGTIVLALILILFIGVSTAFEIIPVGMPLTMIVGMLVGMKNAAGWTNVVSMLPVVIVFSLLFQFGMNYYNQKIKGEVPLENGD